MTSSTRLTVVALVVALLAGCGDGTGPSQQQVGPPAQVSGSGSGQTATAGGKLPEPLAVRVTDARGRAVAGVAVGWAADAGTLSDASTRTDVEGRARVDWTLGTRAGGQTATATVEGLAPLSLAATATAGAPARLEPVWGDGQEGTPGAVLRDTLIVRVSDAHDNTVAGVAVSWAVTAGGGSLAPVSAVTDAQGLARAHWTLGTVAGQNTASVTAAGAGSLTFGARTLPGAAARIARVSGDAQAGTAGSTLPNPLTVRVTDASGNPVGQAQVTWSVTRGDGSLSPMIGVTDAEGLTSAAWTLGTAAGLNTAAATAAGQAVNFAATGVPGPAAQIEKVSGDDQSAAAGSAIADSLTVRVADQHGNAVAGAQVEFRVTAGGGTVSPSTVATTAGGLARAAWTLGAAGGENRAEARLGAVTGSAVAFRANGVVVAGPALTTIAPEMLAPGVTATITGARFSTVPGENSVTVSGVAVAVLSASPTQLTVALPAQAAFPCQPTGPVPVAVRVGDHTATRSHPLMVATQRSLRVGESLSLLGATEILCNELAQTGGRYVVSVFNTSTALGALAPFQLRGAGGAAAAPAAATLGVRQTVPPLERGPEPEIYRGVPLREWRRWEDRHLQMLEADRRLLQQLGPYPRPAAELRSLTTAAGSTSVFGSAKQGDTLTVRMQNGWNVNGCTEFSEVRGRVVHAGARGLMVEDVGAPLAGTMDAVYARIGREFEEKMLSTLESYFGNPLAMDSRLGNSGRVLTFFSPRVNQMEVGGYVTSLNFWPRSSCAGSNETQMSYMNVPMNASSVSSWARWALSTVMHETKHVASFAERLSRNASRWEESWLEESTARISEEIYVRHHFGYAQNGNVNFATGYHCEVHWSTADCINTPSLASKVFPVLYRYQEENEVLTPLGRARDNDWTFYASGWSLVRWAADHAPLAEAAFFRALTQETQLSGVANLQARTGRSFAEMLADWTLANAVDDYSGFTPARAELSHRSWNTRDIFAGLNRTWPSTYTRAVPLGSRAVGFGTFLIDVPGVRAGTGAIFEISGTQTTRQLLELRAAGGGVPAPTLRMAIVRVQ